MLVIIGKITSIFMLLAIGFLFVKFKWLNVEAKTYLSKFLLNLCLPCMILGSITSNTLTKESLGTTLTVLLFGICYYIAMSIIALLACKYVFKVPKEDLGAYILLIGSNNTGFLGFPVASAIFGDDMLFLMIIFNITLTIYANAFGPVLITLGDKKSGKNDALKAFFNVNTICSIIALIMFFTKLKFPTLIFNTIDMIGDITVPLSLFIIGMQLGLSDWGKLVKNVKQLVMVVLKMTIIPALIFFVVRLFNFAPELKVCFVLASTLPSAAIITSISEVKGKNTQLCAEFTALATLISVATIPIVSTILTKIYM